MTANNDRPDKLPLPEFPVLTPEELAQTVVVLVKGLNLFGQPVYSYVRLTLLKFRELSEALYESRNFKPSDFGDVLASGSGEPSEELRRDMQEKHNMVDIKKTDSPPQRASQPRDPDISFDSAEPLPPLDIVPDLSEPPPFSSFELRLTDAPEGDTA